MKFKKLMSFFLSFLMLIGNPSAFLGLCLSNGLRIGLPAFMTSLFFSAKVWAAHQEPALHRVVDMTNPDISYDPTDGELAKVRAYGVPWVPTSAPLQKGENRELALALKSDLSDPSDETLQKLENFVKDHPQSRWVAAVELNRGMALVQNGYYSRAMEAFQASWDAGKTEKGAAKLLATRALAELLRMNSRFGRKDEMKKLLDEVEARGPEGIASREWKEAKDLLWMMENKSEKAFRCGALALETILKFEKSKRSNDPALLNSKSTEQGMALDDLWKLSRKLGMGMQMVKRQPGAKVPLPALVHWKGGHYAALLEEKNGALLCQDPVFGNGEWISQKALDEESSGYFLVPEGSLSDGWVKVDSDVASTIWGSGPPNRTETPTPTPTCTPDCPTCGKGMPVADIDLGAVALTLHDIPLNYTPPIGPKISFELNYHSQSPLPLPFSNFGPNWNFNWQGFIRYTYSTSGGTAQATGYNLFAAGGGAEVLTMVSGSGGSLSGYGQYTRGLVTAGPPLASGPAAGLPGSFTRQLSDGTLEVYSLTVVEAGDVFMLLTQKTDPQGNRVNFSYDNQNRLTAIQDASGQTCRFSYNGTDAKVGQITDPFGRFAAFSYFPDGRLESITDQLGLTTSFTYMGNPADLLQSMTTPYGTTSFDYSGSNDVQITDPMGLVRHARAVPFGPAPSDESLAPPSGILSGASLHEANTYYWDAKAMEENPLDFSSATIYHYLRQGSDHFTQSGVLGSVKKPLESRVWYNYPGQTTGDDETSFAMITSPSVTSRYVFDSLENQASQEFQRTYNSFGQITSYSDPKGRSFTYNYDTNGIDLLSVVDENNETLMSQTYDGNHNVLSQTDAAGQTTFYTYNTAGQILTIMTPMHELTSYHYDGQGNLTSIVPPQPGSTISHTYDNIGRILTTTNSVKGTLVYHYDNMDRLKQIDYPDGTHETYNYDKLDLQSITDRKNRTTSYQYDADRRKISVTDPKIQTTNYGWCECGSLTSMTDPKGNKTTFVYDLEGRLIQKIYPDLSSYSYEYDTNSGRLLLMTDPKKQSAKYLYDLDDKLVSQEYLNAQVTTPNVSYQYDLVLGRLTTVTDGTGTSNFTYYPIGQVGGNQIQNFSEPIGSTLADITYQYDADGRVTNRSIDGVAEIYGFNAFGQLAQVQNPLGNFSYTYDSSTARLSEVDYPNSQKTQYDFFGPSNPLGASGSLKDITNLGGGSTNGQILSRFSYTYNPASEITALQQQLSNNASDSKTYGLGYDSDSEMQSVTLTSGTSGFDGLATNQAVTYGFDTAGNRVVEQTPNFLHAFGINNLNQLSNETDKPINVVGFTNLSATVKVNGQDVPEDADNNFATTIQPTTGNSTPLTIQSVASDGAVTTKKNHILNTQPFIYDANGNLIQDGRKKYVWDAKDRLVQINYLEDEPPSMADNIQMSYDGIGHRSSIIERHGKTVLTSKTFVWIKDDLCEERDSTGHSVSKRFFELGEQLNGINYYYTKDHLSSIREMVDSNGAIHARYDYDPYGRQLKLSGDLNSDFGYTGFYLERSASLDLTHFRVYDPEKGTWFSRDPLAEGANLNLYEYVRNCPLIFSDPLGLTPFPGFNWCGPGNNPLPPSSFLDSCCKTHDLCYGSANISASDNTGNTPLSPSQKCGRTKCDKELCKCAFKMIPLTVIVDGTYYTVWSYAIVGWSCIYQPLRYPPPKKCCP